MFEQVAQTSGSQWWGMSVEFAPSPRLLATPRDILGCENWGWEMPLAISWVEARHVAKQPTITGQSQNKELLVPGLRNSTQDENREERRLRKKTTATKKPNTKQTKQKPNNQAMHFTQTYKNGDF